MSQPSRSVKAILIAGGFPHTEVSIDFFTHEQKGEAFKLINPRQQCPYIVQDGGFSLGESNAILKYLCETNAQVPENYWPKDLKERARVDMFLEYY